MTAELPDPLVSSDCDLRDFAFLPLEGRRLLTSETWILGTPEERCAALCLWIEAWYQMPAASLPDNDRMLAHLSQTGARWPKVKAHAMRGWVKASDGRLYHPVLAEKARDAWERKQAQRKRTAAARAARHPGNETAPVKPSVTETVANQVTESKGQGQGEGQGQGKKQKPSPSAVRSDEMWRSPPFGTNKDSALAKRMFEAVKVVAPSAKEPTWRNWSNAIRLMREQDDRTHDEIWALFDWANRDKFWCNVVLSPAALRDKWTQLDAKRGNGARGAPPVVDTRWWKSDEGVKAHGATLGLERREKEDVLAFKARVCIASGEGPWMDPRDATLSRFIREIRAEGRAASPGSTNLTEGVNADGRF